jgi:3-phosphoshikimate 1-carboxyvinyltransferase
MDKFLKQITYQGEHHLKICGSKSESNRLLILKALFPQVNIKNLSTSDDTIVLKHALEHNEDVIDIHHAGTAMRFLTAYLAFNTKKAVMITGSERMQNRPIKILVDALRTLGCRIEYEKKTGYPPLNIFPSKINKSEVKLQADVSSQYISALMLSAPSLSNGLNIKFTSKITSLPYIKMTAGLMKKLGLNVDFNEQFIQVQAGHPTGKITLDVESDWSSASYYYSLVALSPNLSLNLSTYNKNSLQGDAVLADIYKNLGVETAYIGNSVKLLNSGNINISKEGLYLDLNHSPDLAQTIAVTCLGLNINCHLTGLHTLKIKETDRLVALKTEIEKFGAKVEIGQDYLKLIPVINLNENQHVETYNDHRMAMSFAPLSTKTSLYIKDSAVVTKSYPNFWQDFNNIIA